MEKTDTMERLEELVLECRKKKIEGKRVDLVPVTRDKMDCVLALRSQEKSRYFLNQEEGLTLEDQERWFDAYQERLDDLYWFFCDKQGRIEGTVRLSGICQDSAGLDSGTGDNSVKNIFMDFIAAQDMAIDYAFRVLKINKLTAVVRSDNGPVLGMNKHQGFRITGEEEIRGAVYVLEELLNPDCGR